MSLGKKNVANCKRAPKTCALLEKFHEAASCTRGQVTLITFCVCLG